MVIKNIKDFYKIENIKEIKNTPPNSILIFDFDKNLMEFCKKNSIEYAVYADSILKIVFANEYEATFIVVDKNLAKEAQKIADSYLFDSKILVKIRFEWEIENFAKLGIDGVLLYNPF